MSEIVLLDTTIYLNVLNVEGKNQHRTEVLDEFKKRAENDASFLLPMATIWETGNHIARLSDGGRRRKFAQELVDDVSKALNGETPYRTTYFPNREEFLQWLVKFPEYAQRNKSEEKLREGISLADLSIIQEWERTRRLHPSSRVCIWSLDIDLKAYDHAPK